jgi:ABC-type transport system substrate-binding protein
VTRRWISRVFRQSAIALIVVVVAFTGLLSGTAAGEPVPKREGKKIDYNATVKFAIGYGQTSLAPHTVTFTLPWLTPLYDRLVMYNPASDKIDFAPMLAKSWKVSSDGLTWTWTLREGVKFQDGTPFNAAAVKANMEDSKSKGGAAVFKNITNVEVVDDTHVVFRLSAPIPGMLQQMASTLATMVCPNSLNAPDIATKPCGAGPFKLVSQNPQGDNVYERWDGYWDPKAIYAKTLIISNVIDENAHLSGLQTGTYDAVSLVDPSLITQARNLKGYTSTLTYGTNSMAVFLNNAKPPFDDVRVRRAVQFALDRKTVAKTIMQGLGPPAYQVFVPEMATGYDKALDKDIYNLKKAQKLVKEAGVDGTTVQFLWQNGGFPTLQLGQYVQQQLGKIGIKVELNPINNTSFRPEYYKGQYHGMTTGVLGQFDPADFLPRCCLYNVGQSDQLAQTPELQAMADKAASLPFGSAERTKAYQAIGKYLIENPGSAIPLVRFWYAIVARPGVVGVDRIQKSSVGTLEWKWFGKTKTN